MAEVTLRQIVLGLGCWTLFCCAIKTVWVIAVGQLAFTPVERVTTIIGLLVLLLVFFFVICWVLVFITTNWTKPLKNWKWFP